MKWQCSSAGAGVVSLVDRNGGTAAQFAGGRYSRQPQRSESSVRRPAASAPGLRPSTAGRRREAVVRRTDGVPAVPGGASPVQTHAVGRGDCRRSMSSDAAWSMPHSPAPASRRRQSTVTHARRAPAAATRTAATISATRLVAGVVYNWWPSADILCGRPPYTALRSPNANPNPDFWAHPLPLGTRRP